MKLQNHRYGYLLMIFITLVTMFAFIGLLSTDAFAESSFSCLNVTEISVSECEALVAIYNKTNGGNWASNTNWLQSAYPCSWHGVYCSNGHVIELQLDSNQLSGNLPQEIGNLSNLRVLNFRDNLISGIIPIEIGNLNNLFYLNISRNLLIGSIPPELGNLTNVGFLNLTRNQLIGSIPIEFPQTEYQLQSDPCGRS